MASPCGRGLCNCMGHLWAGSATDLQAERLEGQHAERVAQGGTRSRCFVRTGQLACPREAHGGDVGARAAAVERLLWWGRTDERCVDPMPAARAASRRQVRGDGRRVGAGAPTVSDCFAWPRALRGP